MKPRYDLTPAPPKFQPGQRVKLSAEGARWLIAPAGTTGVVEQCGLVVLVKLDGQTDAKQYAPDFWEVE